jgi:hypothetical protein
VHRPYSYSADYGSGNIPYTQQPHPYTQNSVVTQAKSKKKKSRMQKLREERAAQRTNNDGEGLEGPDLTCLEGCDCECCCACAGDAGEAVVMAIACPFMLICS